ncbi:hypothetical protein Plhal304r1_c012g0045041 [Plasmopara halstedii]
MRQVRTYIDSEFKIDNDYAPLLDQYLRFRFDDEIIDWSLDEVTAFNTLSHQVRFE